ncbi:alpha-protein kinase 2 [Cololabis saira]|uniref:alpha-protein kinase 2 n=1 Tax=Cololabis saira TaxID=129043 RepID=UPI002AD55784|nr:alpha-protein kinase 2 [Cololabis saira]
MDLLSTDDENWSVPTLTDCQIKDSDTVSELSGIDAVSELSDSKVDFARNVSSHGRDPDGVNSLTPGCRSSQRCSLISDQSPKDDGVRIHSCLGPSESKLPILPQVSRAFISPRSIFTGSVYFSRSQAMSTPESRSDNLMEPSFTESEHSQYKTVFGSLSDSLDSDTAVEPMPDLYIFESGTHDFTLSQAADANKITCPEYLPSSQAGVEKANCDVHVLMSNSAGIVTQCHGSSSEERHKENDVSDVSQHEELRAPAVDTGKVDSMSVNNAGSGKPEVNDVTLRMRHNSPIEIWLDACQYLTDEDAEDWDVLDKTGYSLMQGDHSASSVPFITAEERKVSDYNPISSKGIGWSSDDTRGRGPPFERWPSVDSWATALSDWTGIIEASPEDITTVFAEIGAGIDALTQALEEANTNIESDALREGPETTVEEERQQTMGVQDQHLKTQNISESSIQAEQSGLSLCLKAAGPELLDGGSQRTECPYEWEAGDLPSCQAECSSSMGPSSGNGDQPGIPPGLYSVDGNEIPLTAGSTSSGDADPSQFSGYIKFLETDISDHSEDDQIILNITEDADLNTPAELGFEKPFGDLLCQVTDECGPLQLDSVALQQLDCRGNKTTADLSFLTRDREIKSDLPGVGKQPDLQTHPRSNTLGGFDGALLEERHLGSPEFIVPLAPLCTGASFVCRTNSNLEANQIHTKRSVNDSISCHHILHNTLSPTPDGITMESFLRGREKLIHKRQNIINTTKESSLDPLQEIHTGDATKFFLPARQTPTERSSNLSGQPADFTLDPADNLFISKENRVAYITLDLNDPFVPRPAKPVKTATKPKKVELNMPHRTHKDSKARSKKEKSAGHHHHHHHVQSSKMPESPHHVSPQQISKQQESLATTGENHTSDNCPPGLESKDVQQVIETAVRNEKSTSKYHGKKKKKHGQNTTVKSGGESLIDVDNGTKPKTAKGKVDMFEAKLGTKAGKVHKDSDQTDGTEKRNDKPEAKAPQEEQGQRHADHKDQSKNLTKPLNDDVIKRRRLFGDTFGKIISNLETKLPKTDASITAKGEESQANVGAARKKAYSEAVKQKIPPREDIKVLQPIQAESVSGDPQSLCLWCQFAAGSSDYTVTWSREGAVLAETKRSGGDESRVSLTISKAACKDLGKYQCRLSSSHGSVSLDYLLTYEVLSEIVIPQSPNNVSSAPEDVCREEEDVHCSRLLFRKDFLSDQYFGEKHPISILTEKIHFGEGMHRRAFRTKLQTGQMPLLVSGHSCVLKVHNSISYGTKNNDELIQKNFSLAVEECQVQNTAREYIQAYTAAAQSVEAFGHIPEIIPIYLVHRPSNDIPYATLEEELIGDFVKYSVKDGKEINLRRRDSEAGQKCCAFQHWVYENTEGNLLVTDMQGVGMRLTDVGISTCKKGYKGFKGNCSTSFIDQFKALHQCNKYCEILGLTSMQPKAKKPSAPKKKPPPSAAPKKKTCGPPIKGKS